MGGVYGVGEGHFFGWKGISFQSAAYNISLVTKWRQFSCIFVSSPLHLTALLLSFVPPSDLCQQLNWLTTVEKSFDAGLQWIIWSRLSRDERYAERLIWIMAIVENLSSIVGTLGNMFIFKRDRCDRQGSKLFHRVGVDRKPEGNYIEDFFYCIFCEFV